MSRPRKHIDRELVEKLATIHCTLEEIADVCDCSVDTLQRRCKPELARGRANGKASLRRYQWANAQKGNATMQIWLGKQLLNQRDNIPPEDGGGRPFTLKYTVDEK